MKFSKSQVWTAAFSFIFFSLIVKFVGPVIIENIYRAGVPQWFNILTGAQGIQPLTFYLGRLEEILFGPLSMILAGLGFLMICLRYHCQLSAKTFGFAVFAFLLVTKLEVMLFPPYGDAVSGPFVEAVWLLRNHFDYVQLSRETIFVLGGPKVYLFSIYPTFQALLMKFLPNPNLFLIINHLITFALGAALVSMMHQIFLKVFDSKKSVLLTFFFFALPLFHSQVEQINMEIPVLFFVVFALYDLSNKNTTRAAVMAGLAAFTKVYALYAGVAVLLVGLWIFLQAHERKEKKRVLCSAFLSGILVIFGAYAFFFVVNTSAQADKVGLFSGWPLIRKFPITYFYLISLIIFAVRYYFFKKQHQQPLIKTVNIFLNRHYVVSVMHLCSLGWFAVFLNSYWIPPRYTLILLPCLFVCVADAVFWILMFLKKDKFIEGSLIFTIFLSLLSSYGLVYPPISIQNHSVTERSLEYRNDVRLHMKIARTVEEKHASQIIAAPFTLAQLLAFPEIGYVRRQLDVMIYLFPCTYGNIRNFEGLDKIDIRNVVWVGVKTPFVVHPFFPVGPGDKVIAELTYGNKSAQLFLGGFSVDKVYQAGQALVEYLRTQGFEDKLKKL